ncbi:MAG: HAD family hydrolase [Candidatus Bilamarchaeum sp.]
MASQTRVFLLENIQRQVVPNTPKLNPELWRGKLVLVDFDRTLIGLELRTPYEMELNYWGNNDRCPLPGFPRQKLSDSERDSLRDRAPNALTTLSQSIGRYTNIAKVDRLNVNLIAGLFGIREAGGIVAIFTGSRRQYLEAVLQKIRDAKKEIPYIDTFTREDGTEWAKQPYGKCYGVAINKYGIKDPYQNVLVIGDNPKSDFPVEPFGIVALIAQIEHYGIDTAQRLEQLLVDGNGGFLRGFESHLERHTAPHCREYLLGETYSDRYFTRFVHFAKDPYVDYPYRGPNNIMRIEDISKNPEHEKLRKEYR